MSGCAWFAPSSIGNSSREEEESIIVGEKSSPGGGGGADCCACLPSAKMGAGAWASSDAIPLAAASRSRDHP